VGADGQLRIYGDGSAGSLTIAANTDWNTAPPPNQNLQFTDLTINSGVTLTVPSGLVIRVSGNFNNAGTIAVSTYGQGAFIDFDANGNGGFAYSPPDRGLSRAPAGHGERFTGAGSVFLQPGLGGVGAANAMAAGAILSPGPWGGGGGAAALSQSGGGFNGFGGAGGGTLVVLAMGTITNTGVIRADGASVGGTEGSGGGGGGLVILASQTSVTHGGTIQALGGGGSGSGVSNGAGGGGGGGIVQLIAPTTVVTGTVNVVGGPAGTAGAPGSITDTASRMAGAGGGGSGGSGGSGGAVVAADPQAASPGGTGFVLVRQLNPTALF
jgi:hypothetical protein